MGSIFGSSPSVQQTSQPTINTTQQQLLSQIASLIGSGITGGAAGPITSGILTPGATGIINQITGAAAGVPQQGTGVSQKAQGALGNVLAANAPQVAAPTATAPGAVTTSPVQANNIDASQAFTQGVAQPLITAFNTQLAPTLKGAQAGSAGGVYSSGAGVQDQQAATNLEQTLAQQGTLYGLGAQQANQNANLAASTSNAANTLSANTTNAGNTLATTLANLSAQLGTNQLNTGATLGEQGIQTTAASAAPSVQYGGSADMASILQSLLSGSLAPTNELNQLLQTGEGTSTAGTVANNTVVQPGQTGLLPSLATGLLSSSGFGSAFGNWLFNPASAATDALGTVSDERVKDDVTPVGKLDNGLPVYTFRYKGDPITRLGLVAQDVEKVKPEAVREVGGVKTVNYALAALRMRKAA